MNVTKISLVNNRSDKVKDFLFWLIILIAYVTFFFKVSSTIPVFCLLFYTYIIRDKFSFTVDLKFKFPFFCLYVALFVVYAYLTMLWAINTEFVSIQADHLLKNMIGMFIIYYCVKSEKDNVEKLLKTVMWGGYCVVLVYVIVFAVKFGISNFTSFILDSERMDNAIMNVNNLAMASSFSFIIHLYFGLNEKFRITNLAMISTLLILAFSRSRKGFIIVLCGSLLILLQSRWNNKQKLFSIIKVLILLIVFVIATYFLLKLPVFSRLNERITSLLYIFSDKNKADASAVTRLRYRDIGFTIFRKYPILGVGLNNPCVFVKQYTGRLVYLHENFLEILAGCGIVGFIIYYSMYFYVGYNFIKYRKNESKTYFLCVILFLLTLVMHFGNVSYRFSFEYLYLMIFYFEIKNLRLKIANSKTS